MNVIQDQFVDDFGQLQHETVENGREWLSTMRKQAIAAYAQLGLPTIHDEEWRHTNLAPFAKHTFRRLPAKKDMGEISGKLAPHLLGDAACAEFVFVNGHYSAALSRLDAKKLPKGVRLCSLQDAFNSDRELVQKHLGKYCDFRNKSFAALNTALMQDGAFIYVPKGVVLEAPIHICFVTSDPAASYPRNLVIAEANSQFQLVESYVSVCSDAYLTNSVTELVAADNAVVEHCRLEQENEVAFHFGTLQIHQHGTSNVTSHNVALGGRLVRNDINALVDHEGAVCTLNGLYLGRGEQLIDNHTLIDHAKANCNSYEVYKGILDGKARGVFNGKIIVRPDAQKIDAKQSNNTLLLSDEALINTKPQLEIFADDVKCTHGATIGCLDENAVFYLRSRGIGESEARSLLTFAFASELFGRIGVEPVRRRLADAVWSRLPGGERFRGATL